MTGSALAARARPLLQQGRGMLAYAAAPAVGLATGPVLARMLGTEGRGELAILLQPLTVAGAIAALGVPAAVTHFLAGGHPAAPTMRRARLVTTLSSLVVYLLLVGYAVLVEARTGMSAGLLSVAWSWVFVEVWVSLRRARAQGEGPLWRLDAERAVYASLRLLAVVGCAWLGLRSVEAYAAATLLPVLLGSLLVLGAAGRSVTAPRAPRRATAGAGAPPGFVRYAGAAAAGTIALTLGNRVDQLLLPVATDRAQLGLYAVAVAVAEVPVVLGTLAARNMFVQASRGDGAGPLWRGVSHVVVAAVVTVVGLVALTPVLVPLVFGEPFRAAVLPTQVLLLATACHVVVDGLTAVQLGRGRALVASVPHLAGLAATVVLFVGTWSVMSSLTAAWVCLVSQAVALVVSLLLLRRTGRPAAGAHEAPDVAAAAV